MPTFDAAIEKNFERPSVIRSKRRTDVNNIFYIIGVVVVVLFIAGYFGFR